MLQTEPIGTVQAWGSPLKEEATELVVGKISTLTGPMSGYPGSMWYTKGDESNPWDNVCGRASVANNAKPIAVTEATTKLKALMDILEADIAYFQILKGQNLAIHKFATLKFNLSEVVALLEK